MKQLINRFAFRNIIYSCRSFSNLNSPYNSYLKYNKNEFKSSCVDSKKYNQIVRKYRKLIVNLEESSQYESLDKICALLLTDLGYKVDKSNFNIYESEEMNELLSEDPFILNKLYIQDNFEDLSKIKHPDTAPIDISEYLSTSLTPLTYFLFPKRISEMNPNEINQYSFDNKLVFYCKIRDESYNDISNNLYDENFYFIILIYYNIYYYMLADIMKEFNQKSIDNLDIDWENPKNAYYKENKNILLNQPLTEMYSLCTSKCGLFHDPVVPNALAYIEDIYNSKSQKGRRMPRIKLFNCLSSILTIEDNLRLTMVWWMNVKFNSGNKKADIPLLEAKSLTIPELYELSVQDISKKQEEFEEWEYDESQNTQEAKKSYEMFRKVVQRRM